MKEFTVKKKGRIHHLKIIMFSFTDLSNDIAFIQQAITIHFPSLSVPFVLLFSLGIGITSTKSETIK